MNRHRILACVSRIWARGRIGCFLLLAAGPLCGCGATMHTLTWKGYDGMEEADSGVYFFDGEEIQTTGLDPEKLIARIPELRRREEKSLKRLFSDGTFSPGELRTLVVVAKVIELPKGDILRISPDYVVGDDPSGPDRTYPWLRWDMWLEDMAKSRGIRVRYGEHPGVEYP